jgi:methylmalonyl-CoA mutase N-terminal domain/subunit
MGGTLTAIEKGYVQGEIHNAAYEAQQRIDRGEAIVVGVNRFQQTETAKAQIFRLNPALEAAQVESLRQVRASRNTTVSEGRLDALEGAARSTENLMPFIVSAAEAYATLGEISDRLRRVFGEYKEN